MLFHYYSRWTTPRNPISLYPYGSSCNYFSYGNFGVFFFFVISGFVIASTLTKTNQIGEFWKRRLIRLIPSMFICSLVTFILISLLDSGNLFPNSHSFKNFLFSLTFLTPEISKKLHLNLEYVNGSYWSLWLEVQFYFVASCIYFISKKRFVSNFIIFTVITCIFDYYFSKILLDKNTINALNLSYNTVNYLQNFKDIFNYIEFSLYFSIGVICFQLYSKEGTGINLIFLTVAVFLLLFTKESLDFTRIRVYHSVFFMVLAFLGFIYLPKLLDRVTFKPFSSIGVASYSLYLIHENLGVLLINKYGSVFGKYSYLFPVLVIALLSGFSILLFKYIEKPLGLYLKKKLI